MGFFDEIFDPKYIFDTDFRQRDDIEQLKRVVDQRSGLHQEIERLEQRVDQLELLCKTLVELVVTKDFAQRQEVTRLMQQLDLEDGLEDGAMKKDVFVDAPHCAGCGKFINRKRELCVYCGTPTELSLQDEPAQEDQEPNP